MAPGKVNHLSDGFRSNLEANNLSQNLCVTLVDHVGDGAMAVIV